MERDVGSVAGHLAGFGLAPFVALGSAVRHSRLFHPAGIVFEGVALPPLEATALDPLAERLRGPILLRFSGGFWKRRQWLDVLGCAIRFTSGPADTHVLSSSDQDLLLATIRHPLTTVVAALSTHFDDYLGNHYFGVSPFEVPPYGRVKVRLTPEPGHFRLDGVARRDERLRAAVRAAPVLLNLQLRGGRVGPEYRTIARLEIRREAQLDPSALTFDPFLTGRGLQPVGFTHGLRIATYRASRWARHRFNTGGRATS